ncbi:hypothetical protein HI914_05198 [Erysiphe necator]|nr:hypothetical protein HI914_05198 [Erysiphe necator]
MVQEPYSLDSDLGISPLMCDSLQDALEFSPASERSHRTIECHYPLSIQLSSSYNSFEPNSTCGVSDENSINNTISYMPVEIQQALSPQCSTEECSIMINNLIQSHDRLGLENEMSPPIHAPNFQTTFMTTLDGRQFPLLSPANSYDSNLIFPSMDWSPVMDVKHRSVHKKVRRRQIPRNANVIRKKNAKYEIPPGETLENIDQLIAEAHGRGDKKAVIRLIGNKRLLRNRLAALESRERKKRYIEKLEKDNKQLSDELNSTKEDLDRALEKINHLERQAAHLKIVIEKIR